MSTKSRKSDPKFIRAYDRGMLRSAFVSLFWSVIAERRKRGRFTLQALARTLGTNKAEVSRWFSGDPNWTINTIANIANALDLDIEIQAKERATGRIFTAAGVRAPIAYVSTSPQRISYLTPGTTETESIAGGPKTLIRIPGAAVTGVSTLSSALQ